MVYNNRPALHDLVALTSYLVTSTKEVDTSLGPRLGSLIHELQRVNAELHKDEDLQQQPQEIVKEHTEALIAGLKLYREVADTYCHNKKDPRRAGAVGGGLLRRRAQGVLEVTNILLTVLGESEETRAQKGVGYEAGDAAHALGKGRRIAECDGLDRPGCNVDLRDNLVIGSGGSSQVYLVDWRGRNGAAKVLDTSTSDGYSEYNKKCFDEEVKILTKMRGADHILQLYEHSQPEYILVTEYMPNGNLSSLLERCRADGNEQLHPVHRHRLEKEVAHGMAALHDEDIVHKDLKTENVLLDGMLRAKVSDFGISRSLNANSTVACHGTWRALAPESIPTGVAGVQRGNPADVYAYAILVWEVATLGKAWSGFRQDECFSEVASKKRPQIPKHATRLEVTLMEACWGHKPNDRPSFQDILGQMEAEEHSPAPATATCEQQSGWWGLRYLWGSTAGERDPTSAAAAAFERETGEETRTESRLGVLASMDHATTTAIVTLATLKEEMDRERAELLAVVEAVNEAEALAKQQEEEAKIRKWYFTCDTEDDLKNGGRFRMEMTQTGADGNDNEILYIDTKKFERPDSLWHTGFRILKGCPQGRELNTFRCTRKPDTEHVEITGMKQDSSALWFLGVSPEKRQVLSSFPSPWVRLFSRSAANWQTAPPRRSTWVVTPTREVNAVTGVFAWKEQYTELRFEWSGAYGEKVKIVRPAGCGVVEFVTWDAELGEFCRDGNRDSAAVFMFKRLSPHTAT